MLLCSKTMLIVLIALLKFKKKLIIHDEHEITFEKKN